MDQPPAQHPPRDPRAPVNLRIKFRSENIDQFIERYAIDVSRGGIFIRTREPLAVGTSLRFDFQLQDTTPLMAGEGTVVWIREHDPSRTGVTPGMGVRFDKLTPASQPVLDRILADKARRDQSGLSIPGATARGGTGMAVRRPSSMFTALDPSALGAGLPASLGGSGAGPLPGSAAASAAPAEAKPLMSTTPGQPVPPAVPLKGPPASPGAGTPAPVPMGGALPMLETQSALGRLSTGPSLAAYGAGAPAGSAAAVPATPPPPPGASRPTAPLGQLGKIPPRPVPAADAASALAKASSPAAAPAVGGIPTAAVADGTDDSDRTQIGDAMPDFSNEPTRVGGPPLPVQPRASGTHPMAITATGSALDAMTAANEAAAKMSLPPIDGGRTTGTGRTTTPGREGLPELGNRPKTPMSVPVVREISRDGHPATTRAAGAAMAPRSHTPTPTLTVRPTAKRRPLGYVIAGVLAGVVIAVIISTRMSQDVREAPAEPAVAATAPVPAPENHAAPPPAGEPAPAAAAAANGPAAANPGAAAPAAAGTEPKAAAAAEAAPPKEALGEAASAKIGEAKPGEAKPSEAKVGEAKRAGAKLAETKPAEAKPEAKPAEPKPAAPAAAEEPKPEAAASAEPEAPSGKSARSKRARKRALAAAAKAEAASGAAPAAAEPAAPAATEPPAAAAAAPAEGTAAAAEGDSGPSRVVKITSTPSGAEVLIDGRSVGKTPYQGKDIDPAAPHALTVKRDGFETYEHMISGSDWLKVKGVPSLRVTVKLRKARAAGDGETKAAEGGEPAAAEPAKAEAPVVEP